MRVAIVAPPWAGKGEGMQRAGTDPFDLAARVRAVLGADNGSGGRTSVELEWIDEPGCIRTQGRACDSLVFLVPEAHAVSTDWLSRVPDSVPILVVTPEPRDIAISLRRHRVFEFVSVAALERELAPSLARAYGSTTLGRASVLVRELQSISPTLRAWLGSSLAAIPPFVSVSASAEKAGSVRKEWQRKFSRSNPKAFLRWVILVRAAGLLEANLTRSLVAKELQISVGVLDRAAEHHLESRLDPAPRKLGSDIRRGFESYLVHTFIGADG